MDLVSAMMQGMGNRGEGDRDKSQNPDCTHPIYGGELVSEAGVRVERRKSEGSAKDGSSQNHVLAA